MLAEGVGGAAVDVREGPSTRGPGRTSKPRFARFATQSHGRKPALRYVTVVRAGRVVLTGRAAQRGLTPAALSGDLLRPAEFEDAWAYSTAPPAFSVCAIVMLPRLSA